MFEDKEFPANDHSLGSDKWGKVEWKRASEIFGDKLKLYEGKIEPNDIKQGRLGDCYFLCCLASLAEWPERIRNLIVEKEISKEGKYTVQLYAKGINKKITIDDRFPCIAGTKEPLFTKGNGPELWVLVLEKAYAKAYGSYANIEAGNVGRAMFELTGYPVRTFKNNEQTLDELWTRLSRWDKSQYAMTACVPEDPAEDLQSTVGLIEGHAYSLIGVMELEKDRCIRLRNPWGNLEWNGAWSDKDPRWTPALRKKADLPDEDDGSFFMKIEDFIKYFDDISVTYTVEKWEFAYKTLKVEKTSYCFEINAKKGAIFVWVRQPKEYQAPMRLCILDPQTRQPYGGSRDVFLASENTCCDKIHLPKDGKYIIFLEFHPDCQAKMPFNVFVYMRAEHGVKCDENAAEPEMAKPGIFLLPEYEKKFGVCDICKVPVGATHTKNNNLLFHKDCFVCKQCGKPLKGFFEIDGDYYCEECGENM